MKKRITLILFILITMVVNTVFAATEVTMEIVEDNVCTIHLNEESTFEKKIVESDLKNHQVTLQLKISNTAEVIIEYKIPEEDSAMGTDDAEQLDDSDKEAVEKPQTEIATEAPEETSDTPKKAPETGDSDMMMGWALLTVTALASIAFVRRKEM